MTVAQLKSELDRGVIKPLYIFTGEEKEVMRKYIHKFNPIIRAKDFESLAPTLRSGGLFSIKYTYLIDNDKKLPDLGLKKILDTIGNNNTVILLWDKIDGRSKFFKEAKAFVYEFNKFDTNYLVGYIQRLLPGTPSQMAGIIALYCNNDVSRIELECDKLSHLGKPITIELIEDLIQKPLDDRIFDMVDSVAKRDQDKALRIYYDLLELGESPVKILSLLFTKFKQIFQIQSYLGLSDKEIMDKTGLTYYQLKFTKELCGTFNLLSLAKIIKECHETEVAIKTGQRDINKQVELLILKFFWKN